MSLNMIDKDFHILRINILKDELKELQNESTHLLEENKNLINRRRTNRLQIQGCRGEIRKMRKLIRTNKKEMR